MMTSIKAKAWLMEDPLMQYYTKHKGSATCEKIDVFKYLIDLCERDIGTAPDSVHEADGILVGYCSQCGEFVGQGDKYCCRCGEHLNWDEVTE